MNFWVFIAVKCNDEPIVLKLLASLGAGFDCASKGEIIKVNAYNFNYNYFLEKNKYIYLNRFKILELHRIVLFSQILLNHQRILLMRKQ